MLFDKLDKLEQPPQQYQISLENIERLEA